MIIFWVSLPLVYLIMWVLHIYHIKLFNSYHLLLDMLVIVPVIAMALLFNSYLVSLKQSVAAILVSKELVYALIIAVIIFLGSLSGEMLVTGKEIVLALFFAYTLTILVEMFLIMKQKINLLKMFRRQAQEDHEKEMQWSKYSIKMILNSSLFTMVGLIVLYILEIVHVHGEDNLGHFAACFTCVNSVFAIRTSVRALMTPYLFHVHGVKNLQRTIDEVNVVKFIALSAIIALTFFYGKYILLLFGAAYVQLYWLLNFMMVGYAIVTFFDFSSAFLVLNGGENMVTWINFFTMISIAIFCGLSYCLFNLVGMVITLVCIRLISSLIMVYHARQETTLRLCSLF